MASAERKLRGVPLKHRGFFLFGCAAWINLDFTVFLRSFWKKEKLYVKEMKKITVDKDDGWLSCDHTFASVSKLY